VDGERDVIRGCVSREGAIAIEVEWDDAGQVTLRLRGEHDTAIDECIMAAIGDWHVEVMPPGHLIHVLR